MISVCLIAPKGVGPSLNIMYLSAMLKAAGIRCRMKDIGLGEAIPVDFSVYVVDGTPLYLREIEDAFNLLPTSSNYKTIAVGHWATLEPNKALRMGFDYVIRGEAELALPHLAGAIAYGLQTERVLSPAPIERINELPPPDRSCVRLYSDAAILTARGCEYRCAHCVLWPGLKGVRYLSSRNIVKEAAICARMNLPHVTLKGTSIARWPNRFEGVIAGLRDIGIPCTFELRASDITPELCQQLITLRQVNITTDALSGSDVILSNINRHETSQSIVEGITCAAQHGVSVSARFLIGLPGESPHTLSATRRVAEQLLEQEVSLTFELNQVHPGSLIHQKPEQYDIQFLRPIPFDEGICTVRTVSLTDWQLLEAITSLRSIKCVSLG